MDAVDTSEREGANAAPDGAALPRASSRRIHMCIDIEGVLRWPDNKLRALFADEHGFKRPASYVRDQLKLELIKGRKVLPMCHPDECPNFDYVNGCPGHEVMVNAPAQRSPSGLRDGDKLPPAVGQMNQEGTR